MSEPQQNPALPGLGQGSVALVQRLAGALASMPRGYRPRTHHLLPNGQPKYINRLIFESSPYLLQHAHNPVNWYPWSEQAFARAKLENKPVFLSIGYSTCHWCHVMERESFEDEQIAAFINQHFIAIKVDREERPDVDDLYMKAVQMLTGHGGWPMTVVMTPDKRPFFGGTYFPARDGDRGAHQGLLTILGELSKAYRGRGQEVVAQAQRVSQRIEAASAPQSPGDVPTASAIERAVLGATASFDGELGGFGRAPKFPRPALPELLLRYQRRTGNAQVLHMVTLTLDKMAAGGLYDHVGGGFHRYSTDAEWLVPHFEKMLYDNAQLVSLYLDGYQVTAAARYAEVVRETLEYVAREMSAAEGGFYSATDADSATPLGHEEEGYFFTWTPAELSATLGPERAGVVASYFAVTAQGNFEGRNILHTPRDAETVARELGISSTTLRTQIDAARPVLYRERSERPAPLRDDKILASWNGLMISAFARAGLILGEARYVARAEQAVDFLKRKMLQQDGSLLRSFKDGHTGSRGYLDDYAFVIAGLLDVFEATARARHLELALALQTQLDSGFWDEQAGGYFMTSGKHEALLARDKPIYDGAEPSGNALAVSNLLRLAEITGQSEHSARAARALAAFSGALQQSPGAHPKLLAALDASLDRPLEVFVIEPAAGGDANALLNAFRKTYLPNRVFIHCREGESLHQLAQLLPALAEKRAIAGKVTAFVCERGRCELPTSDPTVFAQQLSKVHGY